MVFSIMYFMSNFHMFSLPGILENCHFFPIDTKYLNCQMSKFINNYYLDVSWMKNFTYTIIHF